MFKKLGSKIKAKLDTKLPFEILGEVRPLEQRFLDEKDGLYLQADQNFYRYDKKIRQGDKIYLRVAIGFTLFLIVGGITLDEGFTHPVMILLLLVSGIAIVYFLYKIYLNESLHIVLDRQNGLMSFEKTPDDGRNTPYPFNEVTPFWYGAGGVTGNLRMELLVMPKDRQRGGKLEGPDTRCSRLWSFYVWYMDKNRPLPPGSAFDPYRQADFERRKAEGFPKPLYRSHIPTPEATPEQQAERDKYWNEVVEEFQREPESEMYDPNVHRGWKKVKYSKFANQPLVNTYFRYNFEDGRMIYMKTDSEGYGYEPPAGEKYSLTLMDIRKSFF